MRTIYPKMVNCRERLPRGDLNPLSSATRHDLDREGSADNLSALIEREVIPERRKCRQRLVEGPALGPYAIIDRDELAENTRRYGYPADVVDLVERTAHEVVAALESGLGAHGVGRLDAWRRDSAPDPT